MNNEEFQVLVGSLLGDGCITERKHRGGGCLYTEGKRIEDLDYLKWKAKKLEKFHPIIYFDPHIKPNGLFYLTTRVHSELANFRRAWYPNGKKTIIIKDVEKLNPLGLAVWYQDDGYYAYGHYALFLYSCGFTQSENNQLKNYFEKRWEINPKIFVKNNYCSLRFTTRDRDNFLDLVEPHIVPCMVRKLGPKNPLNFYRYRHTRKLQNDWRRRRYNSNPIYHQRRLNQQRKARKKLDKEKQLQYLYRWKDAMKLYKATSEEN